MKKFLSVFFSSVLIIAALPFTVFAANDCVLDGAGVLTDSQRQELNSELDALRNKYSVDVAIVVEDEMSGYDAQQTADDIYDYNNYGMGADYDGILLYVSKSPRNYHFSTHAYGMVAFNDNGLIYLESQVLPHLQNNDYYAAFSAYADAAGELLEMAANGKPYNEKPPKNVAVPFLIAIGAALAIAFIMTGIKLSKMNTARDENYADNYIKQGSFRLDNSLDIYLYSTTTRTAKPKNNSSSSHTSSSGRSHGGRGGSY